MQRILLLIGFFFLVCVDLSAQQYLFPLNRDLEMQTGRYLNEDTTGFHTALKPFIRSELSAIAPLEDIFGYTLRDRSFNRSWVGRKIFKEHLIDINEDELKLSVDPLFNLQVGRESNENRTVFINTRGALVQGDYKGKFFFYSGFRENQACFANYADSLVKTFDIVPGQGKVKYLANRTYDFSQSFGGIAYTLNKHFDFLFAHDKNFIGDGYRSLLLSDNSYNYPFLRMNMSFWKFRYSVIYAVMRELESPYDPDVGFGKKYATIHHLDINVGRRNRLNFGIYEAVMFKPAASRGYELAYLNPMIFIRPVENSLGSPDNVLLGLNARWKMSAHSTMYGQIMLDEFLLGEVRNGRGWWGNKQGFQLGFKSFDVFKVKNLNVQTEFNFVRPYTYTHRSEEQNYTHYNQPLAHPLGANFTEAVNFVNYRYKRWFSEIRIQYARLGEDTAGINYGNNVFLNYNSRPFEYGHYMFNGLRTTLTSAELRISFLVNPKTNFNVMAGVMVRNRSNSLSDQQTQLITFGIRTALENFYFDF